MVLKLWLNGHIHNRPDQKCPSYYHWPKGKPQPEVEKIIEAYKKAFSNVTAIIEHQFEDL